MNSEASRRPKKGWRQLEFKKSICLPSIECAIIYFLLQFILSLVLTCVILSLSYQITEKSVDIDFPNNGISSANLTLGSNISSPVYLYLEYWDYYQNHRIYSKSKSKNQLSAKADGSLSTNCSPLVNYGDIGFTLPGKSNGTEIKPCGLLPVSFFNFTVTMQYFSNGTQNNTTRNIIIDSSGIAWSTDDSNKYVNSPGEYLDVTDNHFKVWMRTSATNHLRKVYGKINQELPSGTYQFNILYNNSNNFLEYQPNLAIKISTTTTIGGKNYVLGWTFFVVMCLSLIWLIAFTVIYFNDKNKKG